MVTIRKSFKKKPKALALGSFSSGEKKLHFSTRWWKNAQKNRYGRITYLPFVEEMGKRDVRKYLNFLYVIIH